MADITPPAGFQLDAPTPPPGFDLDRDRAEDLSERNALAALEKQQSAAQRRAELGEQFYQPTAINDYDLNDVGARWDISRKENLADALDIVQKHIPEGATAIGLQDPESGGRILGFVMEGEEGSPQQFYTIDSPNQLNLSDLADAGGFANLETAFAIGANFVPYMKQAGWLGRTAIDFASAFMGRQADEFMEDGGDGQVESVQAGLANAVFGRGADFVTTARNVRRGAGISSTPKPREAAAVRAAVDQDLPSASVGGPLISRATAIGENLGQGVPGLKWTGVGAINAERRAGVAQRLADNALETEIAEMGDAPLMRLVDSAKGRARATAEVVTGPGVSKERGGRAMMGGMEEYAERTKVVTDSAYDNYLDVGSREGLVYDLEGVKGAAERGLRKYRLSAGTSKQSSGVVGIDGKPIMREVTEYESFGANLDSQLNKLLEQIKSLDTLQTDPVQTAQALKQIRSNLIDLAEKDPFRGSRTASQGTAAGVLKELHNAITLPKGASTEVKEAFERANSLWRARAKTLDAFTFSKTADDIGAGEQLFNRLIGNVTEEHIRVAKKELSKERYEEFRAAAIDDLLRNPKAIEAKLSHMGRGGDLLIPPKMRDALRIYQRDIRNIDKGVLSELFEAQGASVSKVHAIVEAGSPQEIRELVDAGVIQQGELGGLMFQDLIENTTHYVDDRLEVIPSALTARVEKLKGGKFWGMLSDSHKKILQDLETYTSFIKGADSGSSIAAAEIAAQQLQPFTKPAAATAARLKQVQIGIIANLGNTKHVSRLFAGMGPERLPFTKTRAVVIGVLQSLKQMTENREKTPSR